MKLRNLILFLFLSIYANLFSQIPTGYYDSAIGLRKTAMQAALHIIIDNHTVVSYNALHDYYPTTDKKPNGKVWDMYSDIPNGIPPYEFTFGTDKCGNYVQEGDCYNREHSFPQSWFNQASPMVSDLFHVYPTDGKVNGQRSNYPMGEVNSPTWTSLNGSKLGPSSSIGYSGTVFEPIDDYKGDFARTYFYMAVRYYSEDGSWAGSDMVNGSQLKPWALAQMYQWHLADTVSQKEIDRNNAIYGIQHNRNPFIDHPEWVDSIWYDNTAISTSRFDYGLSIAPNPGRNQIEIQIRKMPKAGLQMTIYDLSGRMIMQQPITHETEIVNSSALASGFYLIQFTSTEEQQSQTIKWIKE
jgi:endonuclease I